MSPVTIRHGSTMFTGQLHSPFNSATVLSAASDGKRNNHGRNQSSAGGGFVTPSIIMSAFTVMQMIAFERPPVKMGHDRPDGPKKGPWYKVLPVWAMWKSACDPSVAYSWLAACVTPVLA